MGEEIKKLLLSELENDQLLGWELVEAKQVPYHEVMEFIKEVNETSDQMQFYWSINGFKLTRFFTWGNTYHTTSMAYYPRYIHPILTNNNAKIQAKAWLGKSRKIWENIKAAIIRFFGRL